MELRESGSSVGRGKTPEIYVGGVRREAHAVGRWAGRTERALVVEEVRALGRLGYNKSRIQYNAPV